MQHRGYEDWKWGDEKTNTSIKVTHSLFLFLFSNMHISFSCFYDDPWYFCRSLLHPKTNIVGSNVGVHYSHLVLAAVEEMISQKKFQRQNGRLVASFMKENQLDPMEVQRILDESGISQMGYRTLFKALAKRSKHMAGRETLLPKPTHIRVARWHIK